MPPGRLPKALVLCAVLLGAVAACSADTADPAGPSGSRVSSGGPFDVPGMTMVPEAQQCVSLSGGGSPPLNVEDVWPGATDSGFGASAIGRGPDAALCAMSLPAQASCESAFPWAGLSTGDFLIATGADREVDGLIDTSLPVGHPEGQGKRASLLYFVLHYDRPAPERKGGPSATADWLSEAMSRCASASPGTVGGTQALVGRSPSDGQAAVPETSVLVTRPDTIVWLSFEGDGWTGAERDRTAAIALSKLTG
jgi:hypothetical protein